MSKPELRHSRPVYGPFRAAVEARHLCRVSEPLSESQCLTDGEYDDTPWTDDERDLLRADAWEMLDSFGSKQ